MKSKVINQLPLMSLHYFEKAPSKKDTLEKVSEHSVKETLVITKKPVTEISDRRSTTYTLSLGSNKSSNTGVKRSTRRRQRRRGFKPKRRGRPRRTISGGSW